MQFKDQLISVVGAARSGVSAALALARLGGRVTLSDSKPLSHLPPDLPARLSAAGIAYAVGSDVASALPAGTELVVTSPGVPRTASLLLEAGARSIPIWSEIELAYRLTVAPIVAVTGTNGKTTTTLLIAEMLSESGFDCVPAGNVSADEVKRTLTEAALLFPSETARAAAAAPGESGRPAIAAGDAFPMSGADLAAPGESARPAIAAGDAFPMSGADLARPGESARPAIAAEISSFQLEWVHRFAPRAAVLTNITPDHLNRYADFEDYADTKARLFAAQRESDLAIINMGCPAARRIAERGVPGTLLRLRAGEAPACDSPAAWSDASGLFVRLEPGAVTRIMGPDEMPASLPGVHNIENVLGAAAAALFLGAAPDAVRAAVTGFRGVAHRMEIVAEIDGVRYINNSMCTNIEAAARSLEALDRPAVVIAGGADKELNFSALVPALHARARSVVLIGQTADKMESAFRAGGYNAVTREETLEGALRRASAAAVPGDAVILCPAAASFGMFSDFEERGVRFRAAVLALQGSRL